MTDPIQGARALPAQAAAGFTLVEVMVALGVLVFGVVALIGVLGVGVSERRTAEQRLRAYLLADQVLQRIEQDVFGELPAPMLGEDRELELPELVDQTAEDYGGMKYSVRFASNAESPQLFLATVEVSWLEQGSSVALKFHRVVSPAIPFSRRASGGPAGSQGISNQVGR